MLKASHQTALLVAVSTVCLSKDAIRAQTALTREKMDAALTALIARGLVERKEKGCFSATKAGLDLYAQHGFIPRRAPDRSSKPSTPRRGTAYQRAWNVMRIKSPFTIASVGALAAKEQKLPSLNQWFGALERAGYLRRETRREANGSQRGVGRVIYWLTRNTGMLAPIYSAKSCCVRDPNTGEETPCKR